MLPNAGLVPGFIAMQGSHIQEFKENLLFGKIDLDLGKNQEIEPTGPLRAAGVGQGDAGFRPAVPRHRLLERV